MSGAKPWELNYGDEPAREGGLGATAKPWENNYGEELDDLQVEAPQLSSLSDDFSEGNYGKIASRVVPPLFAYLYPDQAIAEARAAGQGLFKFGDEIEAGVRQFLPESMGGGEYGDIKADIEAQNAAFMQADPVRALGNEVGTGLALAKPAAAVASGAPVGTQIATRLGQMEQAGKLGRWGSNVIKATGLGAAYGAGAAEDVEDMPRRMAKEALMSGGLSAFLHPVIGVAKWGWKGIADNLPPLTNKQAEAHAVRSLVNQGYDGNKAKAALRLEQQTGVQLPASTAYAGNPGQKAHEMTYMDKTSQATRDWLSQREVSNQAAGRKLLKQVYKHIGLTSEEAKHRTALGGQLFDIKPKAGEAQRVKKLTRWKEIEEQLVNDPDFLDDIRATGVEPLKKASKETTRRTKTISDTATKTRTQAEGTRTKYTSKSDSFKAGKSTATDTASDMERRALREADNETTRITEIDELDLDNFNVASLDKLKQWVGSERVYGSQAWAGLDHQGRMYQRNLKRLYDEVLEVADEAVDAATDPNAKNAYKEFRELGGRYAVASEMHKRLMMQPTQGVAGVDLDSVWLQNFRNKETYKELWEATKTLPPQMRTETRRNLSLLNRVTTGLKDSHIHKAFSGLETGQVAGTGNWRTGLQQAAVNVTKGVRNDSIIKVFAQPEKYKETLTRLSKVKDPVKRAEGLRDLLNMTADDWKRAATQDAADMAAAAEQLAIPYGSYYGSQAGSR